MARPCLGEERFQVKPDRLSADLVILCHLLGIRTTKKPRCYAKLSRGQLKNLLQGFQRWPSMLSWITDEQRP